MPNYRQNCDFKQNVEGEKRQKIKRCSLEINLATAKKLPQPDYKKGACIYEKS